MTRPPPRFTPVPLQGAPLQVTLGRTLADARTLPTLDPAATAPAPGPAEAVPASIPPAASPARPHSVLGPGVQFRGIARLGGALTVAGSWQGQVLPPDVAEARGGHITVTETGELLGRVMATEVAVLGRVAGEIDAAGGRVTLHSGAQVSGQVRYGQLQTHDAQIDARLEHVPMLARSRPPDTP